MSRQQNKAERRFLPAQELRVQQSDGRRTITGYAAVFGQRSHDLGNFTEIIAPGAFADSVKTGSDILCLRDHDPKILLGRTKAGTLTLAEDTTGLRFSCDLPNTTHANDLIESISRGDLDGVSFGFRTQKDDWAKDDRGGLTRTLQTVELHEVSPCSFPAYPASNVSLRSCPPQLRSFLAPTRERRTGDDLDCPCECPECEAGNCDDCSEPEFQHNDAAERSHIVTPDVVHRMQMRLALAQRRIAL